MITMIEELDNYTSSYYILEKDLLKKKEETILRYVHL